MSTPTRADPDASGALQTVVEHKTGLGALADLEARLDRPLEDETAWLADVREVLPRLLETLRAHFASEEEGPLFRALPLEFPHLSDRLRRLEGEHGRLLAQIAEAVERAGALEDPEVYELRELSGRLQLLVAVLRRHEAEEDEAVLSAYWEEAGAGD
jgi:hemerythrin-like domain-containing protein